MSSLFSFIFFISFHYSAFLSKDLENIEENFEIIWKIWKKIVKRYGKYGRKVC
jgi:hypothetical protein